MVATRTAVRLAVLGALAAAIGGAGPAPAGSLLHCRVKAWYTLSEPGLLSQTARTRALRAHIGDAFLFDADSGLLRFAPGSAEPLSVIGQGTPDRPEIVAESDADAFSSSRLRIDVGQAGAPFILIRDFDAITGTCERF